MSDDRARRLADDYAQRAARTANAAMRLFLLTLSEEWRAQAGETAPEPRGPRRAAARSRDRETRRPHPGGG